MDYDGSAARNLPLEKQLDLDLRETIPSGYVVDTHGSKVGIEDIKYLQSRFCEDCQLGDKSKRAIRRIEEALNEENILLDGKDTLDMSLFSERDMVRISVEDRSKRPQYEDKLYRMACKKYRQI